MKKPISSDVFPDQAANDPPLCYVIAFAFNVCCQCIHQGK